MKDFRSLLVWRKAHELTLDVYQATKQFPSEEKFGLTSQMRRSAASVPTNIAEGCGRGSSPDFQRFLQVAFGSVSELDYQLILATDLAFLTRPTYDDLYTKLVEIRRMLASLIRRVQS